jgi:polar amino acid transport system permease protein
MSSAELYGSLLDGALLTLQVTGLAVLWGTVAAIVLGVASLSPIGPLRWFVRVYVEIFRGVSAIILLFWVFFALPLLDIELSPLQAGVLALGVNLAAYGTEIVRGAIQSIPRGQTEGAIAVNLSARQRLWSVILPQAIVTMLPPYGNLVIEVMKASALVSLIGLSDLTDQAQDLRLAPGSDSVEIFTATLAIYFAISLGIAGIFRLLERRFGRGLDISRRSGVGASQAGGVK